MWARLPPCGLESSPGSNDGQVDIFLGSLANRGDYLFGGGIDDIESSLVNTLCPLIVDEPAAVNAR